MNRREALALLMVLILPGIFVVYEGAALDGIAPWHTISYLRQQERAGRLGRHRHRRPGADRLSALVAASRSHPHTAVKEASC